MDFAIKPIKICFSIISEHEQKYVLFIDWGAIHCAKHSGVIKTIILKKKITHKDYKRDTLIRYIREKIYNWEQI